MGSDSSGRHNCRWIRWGSKEIDMVREEAQMTMVHTT